LTWYSPFCFGEVLNVVGEEVGIDFCVKEDGKEEGEG
jgi:hypothetical protein